MAVRKIETQEDVSLLNSFGATYFAPGEVGKKVAAETDLYYYETFVGAHEVSVGRGDSIFWLSADKTTALLNRGPYIVESPLFATTVRGYAPEAKTSTIVNKTVLPYINGCSTKQIFAPERPGDPTLQMLTIPPYTSEQAHHIHSTVRAVYVLAGEGLSFVGMEKKTVATRLLPGMVCVLEKMCPHHFETQDSELTVLPVHIWSSIPAAEHNHPMFNGTFEIKSGK